MSKVIHGPGTSQKEKDDLLADPSGKGTWDWEKEKREETPEDRVARSRPPE